MPPLDRTTARTDDQSHVTTVVATRLRDRGVSLSGEESARDLDRLLWALERYDAAVQSRGGDLMTLPHRRDDETVRQYVERLERAAESIRGEPPD